tara:strand:+ start:706 stop:1047 length:342 start_codon:yes stop_codon:yes gene_type:complete
MANTAQAKVKELVGSALYGTIRRDMVNQVSNRGAETSTQIKGIDKVPSNLLRDMYDEIDANMKKTGDIKSPSKAGDKEKKYMGGSVKKKRMGATDYRKGGYVLSTVDNRKKKR